jgi:hypothetical protein
VDTTVLVLVIVVVVLVLALAAFGVALARRRRSESLREQFGPEYERSVAEAGDRKSAETDLRERQRRHNKLEIRELRPEERERFQQSWNSVQRDFVDDPERALRDADRLVVEVMRVRGYPVEDFDRRAKDISVDHADVVHHYREARTVYDASSAGSVDTERQRRALTSYRALVDALLGPKPTPRPEKTSANDPGPADGTETDQPAGNNRLPKEHTS